MKTILVVDDEPAILTLLRYNLEQEHFKVMTATDGAQALTMALQQSFDFIILDLMLPKLDGITVTKKIREAKLKTPIMILTAKDSETDKIVGLEVGQTTMSLNHLVHAKLSRGFGQLNGGRHSL